MLDTVLICLIPQAGMCIHRGDLKFSSRQNSPSRAEPQLIKSRQANSTSSVHLQIRHLPVQDEPLPEE
jgi:hypothetical protein